VRGLGCSMRCVLHHLCCIISDNHAVSSWSHPSTRTHAQVLEILLEIGDDFIESCTLQACNIAKHRSSSSLGVQGEERVHVCIYMYVLECIIIVFLHVHIRVWGRRATASQASMANENTGVRLINERPVDNQHSCSGTVCV
jgi:hypothetical protein